MSWKFFKLSSGSETHFDFLFHIETYLCSKSKSANYSHHSSGSQKRSMETTASIIAFIDLAGKIVGLIIKVNQLWGEAKDLPHDLRDLLDELEDFALVFDELKDQLEYDQARNTRSNSSYINRSFMAANKAKDMLEELAREIYLTIQSKREGLQRTLTSFKLLIKKEKIERYQTRLKRAITLLQTAISTYQM